MKKQLMLVLGLSLGLTIQSHAEVQADDIESSLGRDAAQADQGAGVRGMLQEGRLTRIDVENKQIVVSDQLLHLSDLVIIDGDQRLAHQVVDQLETDSRIMTRQYKPARGKPPMVTEIITQVEPKR